MGQHVTVALVSPLALSTSSGLYSRTDMEQKKAIQLSHTKLKLADLSRELYIKHGWQMPCGRTKRRCQIDLKANPFI